MVALQEIGDDCHIHLIEVDQIDQIEKPMCSLTIEYDRFRLATLDPTRSQKAEFSGSQ